MDLNLKDKLDAALDILKGLFPVVPEPVRKRATDAALDVYEAYADELKQTPNPSSKDKLSAWLVEQACALARSILDAEDNDDA